MGAMQVVKLRDGLWQWGCPHPSWKPGDDWDQVVWSTYFEAPGATVVIDPLLPDGPQDLERFWRALDRDVERRGLPALVVETCNWHRRSGDVVADRFGTPVLGADSEGDPTPGIVRLDLGMPSSNGEVAYRLGDDVLVTGDLIHMREGALAIAPTHWHDESPETLAWHADELASTVARLTRPVPAMILTGHGHETRASAIDAFVRRYD